MEAARRIARPRLHHKKSRTGCTRCRARRVKCNEAKPVCNNCYRHNVPCYYDRVPRPAATTPANQLRPPSSSGTNDSSGDTGRTLETPSRTPLSASLHDAYWELRAFHHFAVATSETLPGSHLPGVRKSWSEQVPVLALSYKPLWNQLVALSALHLLASSNHAEDPALLACRADAHSAALQSYRPALGQLGPDTAEAACFTSILLLVDTFASLQQRRPRLDGYDPPVHWLRVTQGTRAVFEAAETSSGSSSNPASGIMTVIASSNHNQAVSSGGDSGSREFAYLLGPLPGDLEAEAEPEPEQRRDIARAYEETVDRLRLIRAAVEAGEPLLALCRRFMSFACLVPPLFVDLVERKAPRALAVLGHFFALAACARELWWVGETPAREVRAIRDCLPPVLRHLMEWPCEFVADKGNG